LSLAEAAAAHLVAVAVLVVIVRRLAVNLRVAVQAQKLLYLSQAQQTTL
jgi:hypothetical protein